MAQTLVIGIPTPDEYMIGRSVVDICATAMQMNRMPYVAIGIGSSICAGRQQIIRTAKATLGGDSARMLWLDSDIWVRTPPAELAKYMQEADEKGYNIVAPYRRLDQDSSISKVLGEPLKWNELDGLQQYEKVMYAGLGFYYGHTPFDYTFHMSADISEDYNFFTDNKIELRIDKRIVLYHNKRIFI